MSRPYGAVVFRGAALVLGIVALLAAAYLASAETPPADSDQREALTRQLEALEREAAALDQSIQETQSQAKTLQQQIKIFDAEIKRRGLEITRLGLAIRKAELDIRAKAGGIRDLTARIAKNRDALGKNIAELYAYDQENLLVVLVKNETLSDFFSALDNIRDLQGQINALVVDLRTNRSRLEEEKAAVEDFREGQLSLRALAEVEKRAVSGKKLEKDRLLQLTKGKEVIYQQLLNQKKKNIQTLKTQLFYLERTGVKAEDALKYADLAAKRTGIRTAFLLALLEVETGRQFEGGVISAGTYLGTGNWKTDMYDCYINLGRRSAAENQKNAFFKITSELGLDPDTMPVSRRPSYGCGGAMGPAQFIPTTWLLFADRVAELTDNRPPNPWNIEDAFTASATFLADSGATSKAKTGEIAAARTYISGRPNCPASGSSRSACLSYANRVWSLSQDIENAI